MPDYTYIDKTPALLKFLFYPRPDFSKAPPGSTDFFVEVEKGVMISCRFYAGDRTWPCIIYFHGNGEVVSDYDDIAQLYKRRKINLIVADYRGYGASQGKPGFANLVNDAHKVFNYVIKELKGQGYSASCFIMGRSMGSIAALEIAFHHGEQLKGLIIESGFASVSRLITHLGIMEPNQFLEKLENECLEMIGKIRVPALIMHGGSDTLVPAAEGKRVFQTLGCGQKELLIIPYATHNDIIFCDIDKYFGALEKHVYKL